MQVSERRFSAYTVEENCSCNDGRMQINMLCAEINNDSCKVPLRAAGQNHGHADP